MKIEFGTGSRFGQLREDTAYDLVKYAIKIGVKRFDTGVNYGNWKSQPLLGKCLNYFIKNNRAEFRLSSKAGTHSTFRNNYKKFEPNYIEEMIKKSINDLNCSYLDKFFLHGPSKSQIETVGLLERLKALKSKGLIRKIGVNTHDINLMNTISTGYYDCIECILIDYNLIQQNRDKIISKCKENNIEVSAGTSLCQGLLVSSPLKIFFRSKSLFYLARFVFSGNTRKFIKDSSKLRNYIKIKFPNEYQKIALSFVINNPNIESVPIGMLSLKSLNNNVDIALNPLDINITNQISLWCKENLSS